MVLCLDSPMRTLNLRRSFFVSGVAYHATGLILSNSTPAKPQGQASVAKWSSSGAHDAVTGKTIGPKVQPPKSHAEGPTVNEIQRQPGA